MLVFLYHALKDLRKAFSRETPWVLASMIILGFIASNHIMGVTSFCRIFNLGEFEYLSFLHFFHSSAWNLESIVGFWTSFVLAQNVTVTYMGRAIMLGDHTYAVKGATRMPGVVTLRQNSKTQSKPSYFRGHCWGAIGLLIGTLKEPFCLPLDARIHQGEAHLLKEYPEEEAMPWRLVQLAVSIAIAQNLPSILVLDAFFSNSPQ